MSSLDKVKVTNSGYLRICHECNDCKETLADLPTENVEINTIYFVRETEKNYQWTGTEWIEVGGEFEFSGSGGGGGSVITIGDNGNWFIDGVDTGKPSQGEPGVIEKYPGAMIIDYDYETGNTMEMDSDDGLEYDTALTSLKSTVYDVISGVNKNKEKIVALEENGGGDVAETEIDFESSDTEDSEATTWTSVSVLTSGNKIKTIIEEVSKMFKNIRYLYTTRSHVGMVIHSTTLDTEDKVKAIYGGTSWSKIEGRFLLGQSSAYAINTTGGASTVSLSVENLPSHYHSVGAHSHGAGTLKANSNGAHTHDVYRRNGSVTKGSDYAAAQSTENTYKTTSAGAHEHSISGSTANSTAFNSGSTGSGTAHNNMPPYKVVYIWERTS